MAGRSTDEDGAAVDVEDFAGDEAGERGAEEEDRAGDLVDVAGTADGDGGVDAGGDFGISEDGVGHLCPGPAGGDAVGVDAVWGEFGGEALGERDERALAGGVVRVACFAALAGRGRDEDDVAASASRMQGADEHVRSGGMDEAEDAVDVDGLCAAPLGRGHSGDIGFHGGPDAVVEDEDVQVSEGLEGGGDEGFAVFGGGEVLLDGEADGWAAAFGGEGFGLRLGGAIAEGDAGSGLAKEADGSGANAAGASGNEGGAAGQGEGDAGG